MTSKQRTIRQHHRLAVILLCIGVGLVVLSLLLNVAFLMPENFKPRFQDKQYNDCRASHSEIECAKRFKQ